LSRPERTQKPTPKRKRQARRRGQIARSPEIAVAASLLGGLISLRFFAPASTRHFLATTRNLLGSAGGGTHPAVGSIALDLAASAALPFLLVAVVMTVASGVAQTGFALAPEAFKPKLSNLSWRRGAQRLKPSNGGWDGLRAMIKLGVLALAAWPVITDGLPRLLSGHDLDAGLDLTSNLAWSLLVRTTVAAVLVAAVDYSIARIKTARSLRMSHQEVRQDVREAEGDPLVRGQRRRRMAEMSRNRILSVATADVVVANPTHFAVALTYNKGDRAPRVVAKGTNGLALRIRKEAARHGVPVIENKPLARALFRRVKVGHLVPTALFEAVAVVLATAYRRRRRVA
jgi:flagellar biosynthetic protein FlhB